MAIPLLRRREVEYPDSDGKPMAETDVHRELMLHLIDALRRHFLGNPAVYVSGNLFVYYEEGNPGANVSPDVFVVRGVSSANRRTYKVWIEGKSPELVIELTSRSTHLEDLGNKRAIYEALGVKEYYIFDPEGDHFDPAFRAFRLEKGALLPAISRHLESGATVFRSEIVDLELHGHGSELRWVDPATGQALPTSIELALRIEESRACEQAERVRADTAETELARLREELARLRRDEPAS